MSMHVEFKIFSLPLLTYMQQKVVLHTYDFTISHLNLLFCAFKTISLFCQLIVAYVFYRQDEDWHHTNLFVLISYIITFARLSLVWIFYMYALLSSITSLTKCYWTPIGFILEWMVGFLAMSKEFWLSQYTIIFCCLCLSSSINLWIQIAFLQALVVVMYSTSTVDKATTICNLDNQLIALFASVNT